MGPVNVGDMVMQLILFLIIISLIILFFVSLILFIKKRRITQRKTTENSVKVEQKLDRIIELLEQDKSSK